MNNFNFKGQLQLDFEEAKAYMKEEMYLESIELFNTIYNRIRRMDIFMKEYGVEILKSLSYNYRKLGQVSKSIHEIDRAIKMAQFNLLNDNDIRWEKQLAICYMNKGVIYDEQKQYQQAIAQYQQAIPMFAKIIKIENDKVGMMINALINLGTAYYQNFDYINAKSCFTECIEYLGEFEKIDSRGNYAREYIKLIEEAQTK